MRREVEKFVDQTFLSTDGPATVVTGLPEETVAMVFATFSRSSMSLRDTIVKMVLDKELDLEIVAAKSPSERVQSFHKRITIGYGHKSVADHATVHWALEGVSTIAERDFLSARLLAATSQSTRFMDFSEAGWVDPPTDVQEQIDDSAVLCDYLINAYAHLKGPAVEAVRELVPFDDSWKTQKGWEGATEKRALDMIRDILPSGVRVRFGVSCSATALREILDKRETGADWQSREITECAQSIRRVARVALPTLIPEDPRVVPRQPKPVSAWNTAPPDVRANMRSTVSLLSLPHWPTVQDTVGVPISELIDRWTNQRGHHMVPDRSAETPTYVVSGIIPQAIHRDLGRHRMMCVLDGRLDNSIGFGCDPLLDDVVACSKSPILNRVREMRFRTILRADATLTKMRERGVPQVVIQYSCPMAAMVPIRWVVNLRELVHIAGLRTTPQGHPSYRSVVQSVVRMISVADPVVAPLLSAVTNFKDVTVGRPE